MDAGSLAELGGLRVGDQLMAVDGQNVELATSETAAALVKYAPVVIGSYSVVDSFYNINKYLQCFCAVGWAAGRGHLAWLPVRGELQVLLHMAQLMPLPLSISCCNKSRLVPAHPGSPGQRVSRYQR